MAKYRKTIVAVLGVVLTLLADLPLEGKAADVVRAVILLATAFGVYQVPNRPAATEVQSWGPRFRRGRRP